MLIAKQPVGAACFISALLASWLNVAGNDFSCIEDSINDGSTG